MRWSKPRPRDSRIIKKFLIFPKTINYEMRWLESVKFRQYYSYYSR